MGSALKFNVFYAALIAKLALGIGAAFGIDHENVGFYHVEGRNEIEHAASLVNIRVLYRLDVLHHKQAFLLGEHRLAVLVLFVCCVGANSYIKVAELRRLLEELHMAAVQQVITTADKYFLVHLYLIALFYTLLLAKCLVAYAAYAVTTIKQNVGKR